jgi:spore germination cell wall hydrolase CwlJ-like protein
MRYLLKTLIPIIACYSGTAVSSNDDLSFLQQSVVKKAKIKPHKKIKHGHIKELPEIAKKDNAIICMARNIYHEARGESTQGKIAVANVTMNRAKSYKYPNDICSVMYQRGHGGCAFSWTCNNRNKYSNINNELFRESIKIAENVISGKEKDVTGGAEFFHASWGKKHRRNGLQIGNQVFYK